MFQHISEIYRNDDNYSFFLKDECFHIKFNAILSPTMLLYKNIIGTSRIRNNFGAIQLLFFCNFAIAKVVALNLFASTFV